jgi:1-acyl-sn-glycerol-3-phosphate acyltransferase
MILDAPPVRLATAAAYTLYMCQRAMFDKALGKSDEHVQKLAKEWAIGLGDRMQIEIRTTGFDSVDWSKPYVVMANHQSYLDVLALFTALPRTVGVVAKKELYRVPFFAGVMRALGCVSVDRVKKVESLTAMRDAAEKVRGGATIAVFPEGTRSTGDRIQRLKKGPFYLAQLAQVEVLPIGIRGSHALMPRKNTGIHSGVIEVFCGAPISPPAHNDSAGRTALIGRVRSDLGKLASVPLLD